jgi:hypothetical protein
MSGQGPILHAFPSDIRPEPKHGEMRDFHYEDEKGTRTHVFGGSGFLQSVNEKYCAGCKKWVRAEGVIGELKFMAEHGDHK